MFKKLNFFLLLIAALNFSASGFDEAVQGESLLLIKNANLIDGTGRPMRRGIYIVVENGSFKEIGKDLKVPGNARVIDASGNTIIPGIIGAHNHMHIPGNTFLGEAGSKLYLASGVTTIQTCGSASPFKELELSKEIEKAIAIGPEIIPSAPYFTGPGGNPNMIIPRNEKHLKDTLNFWLDKGIKWVKVYRNIRPSDLEIIIKEAHEAGAKVRGHFCSVTFEEAALMGIDVIEHGLNSASDFRTHKANGKCSGGREYMDELDTGSEEVRKLLQLLIDNDVSLNSTLAIYEASIPGRAFAEDRSINLMSEELREAYQNRMKNHGESEADGRIRQDRLKRIMAFEKLFYKMGGNLTSGVDAGRHVLPGFGDQRNFELLIEAGFTSEEAIKIMTGNGAKMLSRHDIGTIEAGKRADFVILKGDLSEQASVIKEVENVYKKGIRYDPELLLEKLQIGRE
ncbi:amidohydrolase family protein [Christiangramia crocea]|uniref:Amidohydrolase family protein n=1 Tax=Christiangramia crocea TaxID=2904124 RepID=A0A9X2A619_9FLAO|nr:amidohydrolase family protein [Gramella crocea]MCG9970591.1 amidohydrolase family protein [Gramella crocea]